MRILILGSNGLIGSAMHSVISKNSNLEVLGSVRNDSVKSFFPESFKNRLVCSGNLEEESNVINLIENVRPNTVINCAGITKHITGSKSPISDITINALLPHRLANVCKKEGIRLIHVSTDCIFSGVSGNYNEKDIPDPVDLYGKTKQLGEVISDNCITVRTSVIGHEINTNYGLLEWFLAQKSCKGFRKAIFSGLPTIEFARVIRDYVLPNMDLSGLYHISSHPISKYDLLKMISLVYNTKIDIVPDDTVRIDRSLDGSLFKLKVGYVAPDWPDLIKLTYDYHNNEGKMNV